MGVFRRLGNTVKPLVDFPKWMNSKQILSDASYIGNMIKTVFSPTKAERQESFEEAMRRLNLNEQILRERYQEFRRLVIIFLILSIGLVSYTLYLFYYAYFRAGILMLVVSGISLAQVFRYHFWMYQIKSRKLGCTMREWFYQGVLGKK